MGRGGDDDHLAPERSMPLQIASSEGLALTAKVLGKYHVILLDVRRGVNGPVTVGAQYCEVGKRGPYGRCGLGERCKVMNFEDPRPKQAGVSRALVDAAEGTNALPVDLTNLRQLLVS